jgi:hypothetical protein
MFGLFDNKRAARIEYAISLLEQILQNQQTNQATSNQTLKGVQHMSSTLDPLAAIITALQAEVTNQTTVNQSAITLIQGIAAQLGTVAQQMANEGADVTALTALQTSLTNNDSSLAAAVTANTPAAPSP